MSQHVENLTEELLDESIKRVRLIHREELAITHRLREGQNDGGVGRSSPILSHPSVPPLFIIDVGTLLLFQGGHATRYVTGE